MEYSCDQPTSAVKWLSKSMFLSWAQNKQDKRLLCDVAISLKSALLCLQHVFSIKLAWRSLTWYSSVEFKKIYKFPLFQMPSSCTTISLDDKDFVIVMNPWDTYFCSWNAYLTCKVHFWSNIHKKQNLLNVENNVCRLSFVLCKWFVSPYLLIWFVPFML